MSTLKKTSEGDYTHHLSCFGSWGDTVALVSAAAALRVKIGVVVQDTMVIFKSQENRKFLLLGLDKHHFTPL